MKDIWSSNKARPSETWNFFYRSGGPVTSKFYWTFIAFTGPTKFGTNFTYSYWCFAFHFYVFVYQWYEVWSELAKGFSIYSATYEKSPTIWRIKSHNSGMKNWNFTKKYTDHINLWSKMSNLFLLNIDNLIPQKCLHCPISLLIQ
jgi:hypothetical protein